MSKEIKVTGHIPMSVRRQVKSAKKRTRRTLKNKKIKKIRTPSKHDIPSHNSQVSKVKSTKPNVPIVHKYKSDKPKGIIQTGNGRIKNKTVKKVRFNLESQGVQTGTFRNAHRVKMKTAKRNHSSKRRSKNHTLKNRRFKIRFTPEEEEKEPIQLTTPDNIETQTGGDLVSRLKEFKTEEASDISIVRV